MQSLIIRRVLPFALCLFSASAFSADWLSNENIDAVSDAIVKEPAFRDGGHEGKMGYYFIRMFKMDWPVKDKDVRATWDIDPKQDTDGDGTPDIDDDDIDGDGKKNHKDNDIDGDGTKNSKDRSPYDSTKQFKSDDPMDTDMDGDMDNDGIPDIFDSFPKDPTKAFVGKRMEKVKKKLVRSMW